VYEPYLIKEGFIQRTPRGRIALDKTYSHLNVDQKTRKDSNESGQNQSTLFEN